MNKRILELVASERLQIIESQVAHVLPESSARSGRRLESGISETESIQGDSALLTAYIAHYDYGVPVSLLLAVILATESDIRMHLSWLRDEIQESKQHQWRYRYRAALFFLRTWRPNMVPSVNYSKMHTA